MRVSVWESPERVAFDDAQMELNIAADRWHDLPDDGQVRDELHRAVAVFRRARAAWVKRVSEGTTGEEAL